PSPPGGDSNRSPPRQWRPDRPGRRTPADGVELARLPWSKGLGPKLRIPLPGAAAAALSWSFWRDAGWLQLCAGLAIFLFGMQCLEEGLRQLAGGRLEQLLARSTGTPLRGLLFGVGGTVLLQPSTLVSLLTIAFISSGLIQLA